MSRRPGRPAGRAYASSGGATSARSSTLRWFDSAGSRPPTHQTTCSASPTARDHDPGVGGVPDNQPSAGEAVRGAASRRPAGQDGRPDTAPHQDRSDVTADEPTADDNDPVWGPRAAHSASKAKLLWSAGRNCRNGEHRNDSAARKHRLPGQTDRSTVPPRRRYRFARVRGSAGAAMRARWAPRAEASGMTEIRDERDPSPTPPLRGGRTGAASHSNVGDGTARRGPSRRDARRLDISRVRPAVGTRRVVPNRARRARRRRTRDGGQPDLDRARPSSPHRGTKRTTYT